MNSGAASNEEASACLFMHARLERDAQSCPLRLQTTKQRAMAVAANRSTLRYL
jgi:hypothetical protein